MPHPNAVGRAPSDHVAGQPAQAVHRLLPARQAGLQPPVSRAPHAHRLIQRRRDEIAAIIRHAQCTVAAAARQRRILGGVGRVAEGVGRVVVDVQDLALVGLPGLAEFSGTEVEDGDVAGGVADDGAGAVGAQAERADQAGRADADLQPGHHRADPRRKKKTIL